jgi:hypothetical protein
MNLDEFLMKYGVVLARRSSLNDKQRFLSAVMQDFGPLGYDAKGVTQKKRFQTTLNIHIGNLQKAKTVIVTPYDQPSRRFFSKGYHPFRDVDSILIKLLSENLIPGILVVIGLVSLGVLVPVNPMLAYGLLIVLTVVMLAVTLLMPQGLRNMANANRSNSGLYVQWSLAQQLKGSSEVAFVLLDHTSLNRHGELMLSTVLASRKAMPQVIYLDCVGVGDTMIVSSDETNQALAKRIANASSGLRAETKTYDVPTINGSALSRFPVSVNVSVGRLKNKQFIIEHIGTPLDVEIQEPVVHAVAQAIKEVCER